jgi:hypothetical protein
MKLDLRSLAVSRIFLGFLVMLDTVFRMQNFEAHYTEEGTLGLGLLQKFYAPTGPCLQCLSPHASWSFFLLVLLFISSFTMMIGWKTRFSIFLTWLLTISLHFRNPLIVDGGDVLLRCFLFWMLFLPTAKVLSHDSHYKKFSAIQNPTIKSWAFLTLPVQIFLLYFASATLKTGAEWWPDGTASGFALSLEAFVTPFGKWITQFPEGLKTMTKFVYLLELMGGFLFFLPAHFRTVGVFIFIAFHMGLGAVLDLALFPWVATACLLSLLPTEAWERMAQRLNWPQFKKQITKAKKIFVLPQKEIILAWMAIPFLASVIAWNILSYQKKAMYEPLRKTMLFLHLDQYWGMFAPYPLKDSGWFEFRTKLWDGNFAQTFAHPKMRYNWDNFKQKPIQGNEYFVDQRWRKYLVNLWERNNASFRVGLAQYLCREWNKEHELPSDKAEQLNMSFRLFVNQEYLVPPREGKPIDLGTYNCPQDDDMSKF